MSRREAWRAPPPPYSKWSAGFRSENDRARRARGRRRNGRTSAYSNRGADGEERDDICGEENPGFWLWTSAHGCHHVRLTEIRLWRLLWLALLAVCCVCLVGAVLWYFYNVFSTAVYTRITQEDASEVDWPVTVVCEKQAFRRSKAQRALSNVVNEAALLTWSLGPGLAQPDVYDTDTRIEATQRNLDSAAARTGSNNNGSYELLAKEIAPTCEEFILECQLGTSTVLNSTDCCGRFLNPEPIISQYGTCFTTSGASSRHTVRGAGENSGVRIVTVHEDASLFDATLAHEDILGTEGAVFALADDHASAVTAVRTRGQTVQIGNVANVGITRSVIDNSDLEFSLIGRMSCVNPGSGTADDTDVDSDFLVGLDVGGTGYTRDNCQTSKDEVLSRNELNCTFSSTHNGFKRCTPQQSATFYHSYRDNATAALGKVPLGTMTDSTRQSLEKACPQDCIMDRYSVTVSTSELSNELRAELGSKLASTGGQNINFVVLKMYLSSLEYSRVHNFPQHGLQFVAEVGGLMAFFLGISVISLFECMCYLCHLVRRNCCRCCDGRDDEEDEENIGNLPPPKYRGGNERSYRRRSLGAGGGGSAGSGEPETYNSYNNHNFNNSNDGSAGSGRSRSSRRPDLSQFDVDDQYNKR